MTYQWIAVTARTGEVIADLTDLDVGGVEARLCDYATMTASLPVATAPQAWVRATVPYAACLLLLDTTASQEAPIPVWGGIITRRVRSGGDTVELSLSTVEAYLDRRFVPDVRYDQVEQCQLAADLVSRAVLDGTTPLVVAYVPGSTRRDRVYTHASDKTVLSALSELSGVIGGPEFTVTWRRVDGGDDPAGYVPVLQIADRIGVSAPVGLSPAVTFEMPGSLHDVELVEDWSAGSGATRVLAVSSPADQDTARPESAPAVAVDHDRPTTEHRWSPSSSITRVDTLTEHAAAALEVLRDGAQALALTATAEQYPRLGQDWALGDDIGYQIGARHPDGTDSVPAFPGGLSGVARAIGWRLDLSNPPRVAPILATTEALVTIEED